MKAGPEAVWNALLTYEEIPVRPPAALRWFLPEPLRTEGDKTKPGNQVMCRYRGGDLVKQITKVEPPGTFGFEVREQHLGVERVVKALRGEYRIEAVGGASEVQLSTCYEAHLSPRWLWRPVEELVVHQMHLHILRGMALALRVEKAGARSERSLSARGGR